MKNGVQTVKSFESLVHKKIKKIFPRLVENEARKIVEAGVTKTAGPIKKPKRSQVDESAKQEDLDRAMDLDDPNLNRPCWDAYQAHGSKTKAAKAMGIAETTFRDRLKKELARAS